MNMTVKKDEPLQIIPQNETAAILSIVARAAADPNVDIDKLERLMQMQERAVDRQAEQEYAAAMMRVQSAMPKIVKNKDNKQTNSRYANLEAITKLVTPVYTHEGFSLSFNTGESNLPNHIRVICDVLHERGHSKQFTYDSPIDDAGIAGAKNKTLTHGRGSAISYGQRYLTKLIFNLVIADEDDDGNAAELSNKWIVIANELVEYPDYLKAKEDLKKAFPMVEKIPPNVKSAFNSALERTKPKD